MEKKSVGTAALAAILILVSLLFVAGCSEALIGAVSADVEKALADDPPAGSVIINANAGYTIDPNVTLAISASGIGGATVIQMEIRNDLAWTGNWQSYATTLPWSLTVGDGAKSVYIRFKDDADNVSSSFSDSIILDTVNPAITTYTPVSSAANQLRSVNAVINFSENMDQSTFTTSTVYLKLKNGSTVPSVMTKAATSVTLNPNSDLLFGYDYNIVVTSGVKDLSGRSITNFMSTNYFTVERDIWEGTLANDLPGYATDLNAFNPYGVISYPFDFFPNLQQEEWVLPTGAHSNLAQLESTDYYVLTLPADTYFLTIDLYFTNDEASGTTIDISGTENIRPYVLVRGAQVVPYQTTVNDNYHKQIIYDLSNPLNIGEDLTIMVYENSYSYVNKRKYNMSILIEPGI